MKSKTISERFWSKVNRPNDYDCWEWTASRHPKGYGKFFADGILRPAHVFAYILCVGPVAPGLFVCHKCDNPPCCNPSHLFLVTPKDNSMDMIRKNRARGFVGPGHLSPFAKLTTEMVLEIRRDCVKGKKGFSYSDFAKKFGVGCDAVRLVAIGATWKGDEYYKTTA